MHEARYRPALLLPHAGRLPARATAAACLVRDGAVLLERRPDDAKVTPGVFDLPGGHLEPGEAPESALVRELTEELGIVATRFRLGMVQDEDGGSVPGFYRHYLYIVEAFDGEVRACEGADLHWIQLTALPSLHPLNPLVAFALDHFVRCGWV